MKQQHPGLGFLFLIGFCGLVLRFPTTQLAAEQTPVPSATPAATSAAGISPAPSPTPEPPSVRWVGVHKWGEEQRGINDIYAQRGDDIWVDVINFKDWVKSLEEKKKKPENSEVRDLILYLDHIPLKGVSPIYWHENTWSMGGVPPVETTDTTVGFSLVRNEDSKLGWSHVLNQPVFTRKAIVPVGFANGEEMPSELTPDKNTGKKGSAVLFDSHSEISHCLRLDRYSWRADRLSRTGTAYAYYSRCICATPAGWSEAVQPGTRTDGVLVFSRDRLLFLSLDRDRRHGHT